MQKLTTDEAIAALLAGQTICKYSDPTIKLEPMAEAGVRQYLPSGPTNRLASLAVLRHITEEGPWAKVWADGVYRAYLVEMSHMLFRLQGQWEQVDGTPIKDINAYQQLKFVRPFPAPLTEEKRETYNREELHMGKLVRAYAMGWDIQNRVSAAKVNFPLAMGLVNTMPLNYVAVPPPVKEKSDD